MAPLPDHFIKEIVRLLQEEEIGVYLLSLYYLDNDDLNYFAPKDRESIKRIFRVLMKDTKDHAELLKLIVDMGGGS